MKAQCHNLLVFYVPSFQYHSTQVMIIYLQHVLAKKNNGIHGAHYMVQSTIQTTELPNIFTRQVLPHFQCAVHKWKVQGSTVTWTWSSSLYPIPRSLITHNKLSFTVPCKTIGSPGWEAQAESKGGILALKSSLGTTSLRHVTHWFCALAWLLLRKDSIAKPEWYVALSSV